METILHDPTLLPRRYIDQRPRVISCWSGVYRGSASLRTESLYTHGSNTLWRVCGVMQWDLAEPWGISATCAENLVWRHRFESSRCHFALIFDIFKAYVKTNQTHIGLLRACSVSQWILIMPCVHLGLIVDIQKQSEHDRNVF